MKPRSVVWRYFVDIKDGSTPPKGKCRYCLAKYVSNATRMANHILKCCKAPSAAKEAVISFASKEAVKKYRPVRQAQPTQASETQVNK